VPFLSPLGASKRHAGASECQVGASNADTGPTDGADVPLVEGAARLPGDRADGLWAIAERRHLPGHLTRHAIGSGEEASSGDRLTRLAGPITRSPGRAVPGGGVTRAGGSPGREGHPGDTTSLMRRADSRTIPRLRGSRPRAGHGHGRVTATRRSMSRSRNQRSGSGISARGAAPARSRHRCAPRCRRPGRCPSRRRGARWACRYRSSRPGSRSVAPAPGA